MSLVAAIHLAQTVHALPAMVNLFVNVLHFTGKRLYKSDWL